MKLVEVWPDCIKESVEGFLPIHLACQNEAPAEVTIKLVEMWLESIKEKAKNGRLPIHFAVQGAAAASVSVKLIELWPEVSRGFLSKQPPQPRAQGEEQRGSGGESEYEYLTTTLGVRYTAAVVDGSWGSKELGVDDGTLLAVEQALREWSTELAREIERGAWW